MSVAFALLRDMPPSSTFAAAVDRSVLVAGWIAVFCAVLVMGAFLVALLVPRASDGLSTGDPRRWIRACGVVAAVSLAVVFVHGAWVWADVRAIPRGALPIRVEVVESAFRFTYPGGHTDGELHLPIARPVRFVFTGGEHPYTFSIPEFRLQAHVAVASDTTAWVEAVVAGELEACSTRRPGPTIVPATVFVHEVGGYESWHQGVSGPPLDLPPVELGRRSYEMRGCTQCHALDATRLVGPGFGGSFAIPRELVDGSRVEATDEYLRESILDPQAKVVAGFEPVMPSFRGRLHELEVEGLVAFLRSLE